MNPPLLEVCDIDFAYPDGYQALREVSMSVSPGERLGMIGGNGAGKSTLLLHLNGVLLPSRGEVRIGGRAVTPRTRALARRTVGLVFQDPDDQLFMPTVFEDVAFGPLNQGVGADAIEAVCLDALARVGMVHLRERPPHRLSAGEKRAVAIAAVLAMSPDVLVMDEPSAHLDPCGRRRLIDQLGRFGHAQIIASHDLGLIAALCSRVLVMDGGRVVATGPTAAILNDSPLLRAHGLAD